MMTQPRIILRHCSEMKHRHDDVDRIMALYGRQRGVEMTPAASWYGWRHHDVTPATKSTLPARGHVVWGAV